MSPTIWTTASRKPLADVVNKKRETWPCKDSSEITAVSLVDEIDETDVCPATLVSDEDSRTSPKPTTTTEP